MTTDTTYRVGLFAVVFGMGLIVAASQSAHEYMHASMQVLEEDMNLQAKVLTKLVVEKEAEAKA